MQVNRLLRGPRGVGGDKYNKNKVDGNAIKC